MNKLIVSLVILTIGFAIGIYVAWQPLPMERLYRDFNYIQVYEDGSYRAEGRDGVPVTGCIRNAICQD